MFFPFLNYIGNTKTLKIKGQHGGGDVYYPILLHSHKHFNILVSAYLFTCL